MIKWIIQFVATVFLTCLSVQHSCPPEHTDWKSVQIIFPAFPPFSRLSMPMLINHNFHKGWNRSCHVHNGKDKHPHE